MKRRLSLLAGAALVALAAFVAITKAEPPSGVTPTILARGTYDGFNVRSDPHGTIADFRAHSTDPIDIIVRQHDYAPHSTTGWHTHPGPVFITVTQGQLTFYELDDPCTPHVVTAGHGFVDSGHGHVVLNTSDQPAQDISVITAPVGGPFRTNIDPPNVHCGVSSLALERFRSSFRGELVLPSDEAYEQARRVWNASVDRRPALIARCSGVVDVVRAVEFAREHELLAAVRGGGHGVAGHGTCDGGIVIDLSRMKGISVDLVRRTVRVEAGATWGDLDHETQAYGLATTGGMVSTTGVAGLALGGGIGWLMRKHGLACDNLLAADVVTAGGRMVRADADENAGLFWGVRGGGGNFGIVTSFEFRLNPVGPVVTAGAIAFDAELAGDVLRFYREWVEGTPDELTTRVSLASLAAAPVVTIAGCYAGDARSAATAFQPLYQVGSPVTDLIGPMSYASLQALVDPSWGPGARNDFSSVYLEALDNDVIQTLVDALAWVGAPRSEIHVYRLGGAVARVAEGETAVGERQAPYLVTILARWLDPDESDAHICWAGDLRSSLSRLGSCRANVNFLGDEGPERILAAYGEKTHARLAALKCAYDPTNFFRVNHNVRPGQPAAGERSSPEAAVPASRA